MKSHRQIRAIDDQEKLKLSLQVIALYFLTVVCVIGTIIYYDIALYTSDQNTSPTVYLFLVWFLYYLAPILLSCVFGFLFRPFVASFRNIYIGILIVQLFYSFIMSMLRLDYLQDLHSKTRWKKSDRIIIAKWTPNHYDRNQDGYIDQIIINVVFDFTRLRPSQYLLQAGIVAQAPLSPFVIDGGGSFVVVKTKVASENMIAKDFVVTAGNDARAVRYQEQNFQMRFLLSRIVHVDYRGKMILSLARWSPFLRVTDWQAQDKDIHEDTFLIDNIIEPEIFSLRAPVLAKQ